MPELTYQFLKDAYSRKNYTFFEGSNPYNLNIFGIRKQYGQIDKFDDALGICYKDEQGNELLYAHKATVDPGKYYLVTQLGNPNGTFILKPGQYLGCWHTGLHGKTDYPALVQKSNYRGFLGWRDHVLNGRLERMLDHNGNYFTDVQGLNMHRSSTSFVALVGEYSAGCQVRQYNVSHQKVMEIIRAALRFFPDSFSYTLFEEEDVFGTPKSSGTTRGSMSGLKKWPEDFINVEK